MVISNITFDALIPSPKGIEKHRRSSCVGEFGNVWKSGVCDKQTNWCINVRGERCSVRSIRIKQLVTWRKGVEVANLTFDPGFVMFPLFGTTGTTTNVTGMLVTKTGAVIPIDTIAAVSGKGLGVAIEIDCSCDAMEQRYEKIGSNLAIAKQLK